MSQTTVNLGMVPNNRGEYNSAETYYKDNIVQYNGSSYICTAAMDLEHPSGITGVAPYDSDPTQPNTGWAVFVNNQGGGDDGIYDVSAAHMTDNTPKSYNSLSDALADIIAAKRKGGMSMRFLLQLYTVVKSTTDTSPASDVRYTEITYDLPDSGTHVASDFPAAFSTNLAGLVAGTASYYYKEESGGTYTTWTVTKVQSSDNKYVQFRYMGTDVTGNPNPFLDTANWQGVDEVPTADSDNLVKSGGVKSAVDTLINSSEEVVVKNMLPTGYSNVECITGVSRYCAIDTGIKPTNTTEVECEFKDSGWRNKGAFFGIFDPNDNTVNAFRLIYQGSNNNKGFFNGNYKTNYAGAVDNLTPNTRHHVILNRAGITLDGVLTTNTNISPGTTQNNNIVINGVELVTPSDEITRTVTWYKFIIRQDGTVVFNGVPCKRDSDGVIGLYDIVSNTFKANAIENAYVFSAGLSVERKVVELKRSIDTTPTVNSKNFVESGGVYNSDLLVSRSRNFIKCFDGESDTENAIMNAVGDIQLIGKFDLSKKYMLKEISRNYGTTAGYEIAIVELNDTTGQQVESTLQVKIPSSNVTELNGYTKLVFNGISTQAKNKAIISIDYSKITGGGILNMGSSACHYIINPSKIIKVSDSLDASDNNPISSGAVKNYVDSSSSNISASISFVKTLAGEESAKENAVLSCVKSIKIYGTGVSKNEKYAVFEITRARNNGYEFILGKVDASGVGTRVFTQKISSSSVTESSGVTQMTFSGSGIVVEIGIDYNQITSGDIINMNGQTFHWTVSPSCVLPMDSEAIEDSNDIISSGGVKNSLNSFHGGIVQKYYFTPDTNRYDTDAASETFFPAIPKQEERYTGQVTPEKRFMCIGFDDFRDADFNFIMPLFEKYGFVGTFNRVGRSAAISVDGRNKIMNVLYGRHEIGDHTWTHNQFPYTDPMFNGQDPDNLDGSQVPFPSNSQMRDDRGDGKNVFGITLTTPVSTTLSLNGPDISTQWGSLSDAECQTIRNWYSVMKDTNSGLITILDALSNKYLGTEGSSNGSWDDTDGEYKGGIFTGCKTSANHEIWEKILKVTNMYFKEVGIPNNIKTWSLPGSKSSSCYFEHNGEKFYDAEFTKRANYLAKIETTSLKNQDGTNKVRSWVDCLREFGFTATHDTLWPGRIDGTTAGNTVITKQFVYSSKGRRKDALPYSSSIRKNFSSTQVANDAYPESAMTGVKSLAAQMYDYTEATYFKTFIENARRNMANGVIDTETTDSETSYSFRLFYEGILKYCKSTGVELVTKQQAYDICFNHRIEGCNLIYNPNMRNTAKEFMPDAETTTNNPDGYWNPDGTYTGVAVTYDSNNVPVLNTGSVAIWYAHYGIPYGNLIYKADVKGSGSIVIKAIKNSDNINYNSLSTIETKNISNAEFANEEISFAVNDVAVDAYDQYEGLGDKIVGVLIEYSAGLEIKNIDMRLT